MDNKCLKKSTMQQLQTLVEYMEENPEFARGAPVFGGNKFSMDEQWKSVSQKLNAFGPPSRSVAEWKKTWADLKCRTKKKIAENNKSLQETGGGVYKQHYLSSLEQTIDRTLLLSSAAAPSGRRFGGRVKNAEAQSVDDCFQMLVESPPSVCKAVTVVTQQNKIEELVPLKVVEIPQILEDNRSNVKTPSKRRRIEIESEEENPTCSSGKKRKTVIEEQLSLIRRQLRVAEKNAVTAKEQADAIKRLANAAELQAKSAKQIAEATLIQANTMKAIMESLQRLEKNVDVQNIV